MFLLFILNPFFAAVLCCIAYSNKLVLSNINKIMLCVIPPLFLGFLNSTKIPDNDMVWYLNLYSDAGNYSLFEYLFWIGEFQHVEGIKEPVYSVFTYISYYLLGGSEKLFVVFHSFLCYSIINYSLIRLGEKIGCEAFIIISAISYADFCPYIFTISAHLFRQVLANAILIFILVDIIIKDKIFAKHYLLMFLMILTHSTSTFFLIIMAIKFFQKPFNRSTSLIYIVFILTLLFLQFISSYLVPLASALGNVGNVINRVNDPGDEEMEGLSIFKVFVSITITIVCLYSIYSTKMKENGKLVLLSNITLFLCILFIGNLHNNVVAIRYNFYIWYFSSIILMIFLYVKKINRQTAQVISISSILFFVYILAFGNTWRYTALESYYYLPLFSYFP